MFLTTLLILWIVCMPTSYLLFRRMEKKMFGSWTKSDRLFALFMSFFGPFAVLINVLVCAVIKLEQSKWANQEAKW